MDPAKLKTLSELQREINKYSLYFNQKEDLDALIVKWKECAKEALTEFKSQGFDMSQVCNNLGFEINDLGLYDPDSDSFY